MNFLRWLFEFPGFKVSKSVCFSGLLCLLSLALSLLSCSPASAIDMTGTLTPFYFQSASSGIPWTRYGSNSGSATKESYNPPSMNYVNMYVYDSDGSATSPGSMSLFNPSLIELIIGTNNLEWKGNTTIDSTARSLGCDIESQVGNVTYWSCLYWNTDEGSGRHIAVSERWNIINSSYVGQLQVLKRIQYRPGFQGNTFETINSSIQAVRSAVSSLQSHIDAVTSAISSLSSTLSSVDGHLGRTEAHVDQIKTKLDTLNQNVTTQGQETNNQLSNLNDSVSETKDFVTDTSVPTSDSIASSESVPGVGLLPAGPLDNLLLLPLNIMNMLVSSLGGTCSPITADIPYFGNKLQLMCMTDIFYTGSLAPLGTLIGVIGGAVILLYYFKHLYKKVERAMSLETTDEDEWGII